MARHRRTRRAEHSASARAAPKKIAAQVSKLTISPGRGGDFQTSSDYQA